MMGTRPGVAVLAALALFGPACMVSRAKYDRSLSVLTTYQAERLQTEADRDAAVAQLQGQLATKAGELAETRDKAAIERAALEAEIAASKEELEAVREQRALTEKRMQEWRLLTSKLASMVSAGKIQVTIRNGRMMVDLPSSVLFESGKADLQDAGVPTLTEVAKVLQAFPGRQFLIAGHTDSVPIANSRLYKDNWELSAARALTVTKFLVKNGLKPKQVAAAGYGQFDPVGNNRTPRGQQMNRRIEIILLPNIAELPKMPEAR